MLLDASGNTLPILANQEPILYFALRAIVTLGIISSLVWLANFIGKKYSQNKRLLEEYSYKATFAKSFEGYRKKAEQLDELSDDVELNTELMKQLISMTAFNPVKTMESKSHKDNHPTIKAIDKALEVVNKTVEIVKT